MGLMVVMALFIIWTGCKKKEDNPTSPSTNIPGNQATATPTQILGSFIVQVNDRTGGVGGVTVIAIPPDQSVTYTVKTQTGGFCYVSPPYIQPGNWSFEVPTQKYFADSKMTAPVTAAFQGVTFSSVGAGPASIYLTPTTSPESFNSAAGGSFTYNLVYQQPGNLLVPVKPIFPILPNNWSASGPASVGFLSTSDQVAITITSSVCVDQSASFAVTGLDFEPTPQIPNGAFSASQTVLKNFTSTMTVQWVNASPFSNVSVCNLEKKLNGTLVVSGTGDCGTVSVYMTECYTNCFTGQFNTPNGNTQAQNDGGGSIAFGPGSYSCTVWSDGCFGTLHAVCNRNGASGSVQCSGNGTQTVLSTSY